MSERYYPTGFDAYSREYYTATASAAWLKQCPQCGRLNPADWRYCPDCGSPLQPIYDVTVTANE